MIKSAFIRLVLEVERSTFTPLVFSTTGGMSNECQRYHSRLAELLAVKKQESYASTSHGLGLESHLPF